MLREHGQARSTSSRRSTASSPASPPSRCRASTRAEHRAHGVRLHLGVGVAEILGRDGARDRRTPHRWHGDRRRAGDRRDRHRAGDPAARSTPARRRRATDSGVLVDDFCRTTIADVYCVGDCSILRNGPGIRIESRQNACEQAHAAAKAISGHPEPLRLVPWFWSNQYDLRLQTIGLNLGHDQIGPSRPSREPELLARLPEERRGHRARLHQRGPRLHPGTQARGGRRTRPPDLLADDRTPLKELIVRGLADRAKPDTGRNHVMQFFVTTREGVAHDVEGARGSLTDAEHPQRRHRRAAGDLRRLPLVRDLPRLRRRACPPARSCPPSRGTRRTCWTPPTISRPVRGWPASWSSDPRWTAPRDDRARGLTPR